MKILTFFGFFVCVSFILSPLTVLGQPEGPPNGLNVNVVNPLPLPVTGDINATVSGDVSVINQPVVDAMQSGEWSVTVENLPSSENSLRDGQVTIGLGSGSTIYPRSYAIPTGVAVTDVVLQYSSASNEDSCAVWFYKVEGGVMGPMITFRPSTDNPIVELHLNSGLRSTEAREIGFFLNSQCRVGTLWTGHEF